MAQPTNSTTVQRPDLGQAAYEYLIDGPNRGFIGMGIMPVFEVMEQTADYPKIPIESLIKMPNTKRTAKGGYARGDWQFEMGTYKCEEYGWEEPIDDVEARLYQRFLDAEMVSTEIAIDHILRGHESRVAAVVQSTANAIGNSAVTTEWSTSATATPRADVMTARQAMRAASGLEPNAIAISKKVMENLLLTAEIRNAFAYTNPIEIGGFEAQRRLLSQYFGVNEVFVGGAIKDGAKKGQAVSIADIWDDEYCSLLVVSGGGARLKEPVFGRSFLWIEDSPETVVVETYREEDIRSTIVRARQHIDEAVIFTGANYLLTNITA